MSDPAPVLDAEPIQALEEGPNLPAILTEDFIAQFERGVERYKRWVAVCYKLTHEGHWLNMGTADKPRYSLQGPGAEALMNPLGINYPEPTIRKEIKRDQLGEFYAYWCEGYVESGTLGRRGWYIGYCDSRDQFFSARPGWTQETGEGDVKKSAFTNWIGNGVARLAGIRDPDPAILRAAGLDPAKVKQVDYSGRRLPEQEQATISEPQRKRLWALCKAHQITEEQLRNFMEERYGYKSTQEITRGTYDAICSWAIGDKRQVEKAEA